MGYVAVKGGELAIEESLKRLRYERLKRGVVLSRRRIEGAMRGLVDQVMSESSLYNEMVAALAIKQAEGSPEEAVFLVRAYRSTLPRKHYSRVAGGDEMTVERRISASFKDIPGGQILGATYDYTHRLIDFGLEEESDEGAVEWVKEYEREQEEAQDTQGRGDKAGKTDLRGLPKVLDYLRAEGLVPCCPQDNREPDDVTRESVQFPTSRSERLQILTRGQTGAVTSLGYAALRGYGAAHPTVGELRIGHLPVYVDNPLNESNEKEDAYYIGEVKLTEVESLFMTDVQNADGQKEIEFSIGYGTCFGQNETKAIAMSILDRCLEIDNPQGPLGDEEFVLLHVDSVESSGFIAHLKLPHYVTFQSKLDSVRKTKTSKEQRG